MNFRVQFVSGVDNAHWFTFAVSLGLLLIWLCLEARIALKQQLS